MPSCSCQISHCVLCEAHLQAGHILEQVCETKGFITKRTFEPHDTLFHGNDPGSHLFILKEGQVKLTTSLPDGREQILGLRVAGQMLGFESLENRSYPYTAQALSTVDVCALKYQDMLDVLQGNPQVALQVIHMLNQELSRSQALIRDLGLKTASEKVASFIISLMPTRGPDSDALPLLLSRQEIAEMLGLTVETVSRTMADFKRKGIIHTPRRLIYILDYTKLRLLAGAKGDYRFRPARALPAMQ